MREACAGVALGYLINQAVNAPTVRHELQKCRTIQQVFKVERHALADQLKRKAEGLVDGLMAGKRRYLKTMINAVVAIDAQAETRLTGRCEHPQLSAVTDEFAR
ncbi:hypothetical protein ALP26_103718 [Pseudomonas savastanoi pv. glycinea]|uniref:Uncharacterized protein n=1 Tax=Pseudomonas savastanoi pv. glycinea TaxID=318 RepID=A0A3M3JNS0_PSESG|nr:hypothetical protein ALQ66_103550 [Pseudomonas savastanoi pv. glycinea]RMO41406.1 hypothetical protein ALQ41_103030 [Pseudomonas savastanoi pv. glycinea]RMU61262.1 hypothetical protein ALP26_103718 [Pseudomonas savastanoi pv. glycinea]